MKASVQDGAFSWLLCLASFFNISVIGGFLYTTGMFYIMFKDSLGATDSQASLMTSINIGVCTGVGPLVGIAIESFGNRWVAMLGSVVSTTGLALSAFSTQVYHMYICYGFIAGVGAGMVNINSITVLGSYFHKYRRMALTIVLAGYGAGSFIVPPILNFLENVYGWRGAMLLLAGINAHTLVTCSLFRPFDGVPCQTEHIKDTVTLKKSSESAIRLQLIENARAIKSKGLEILSLFRIIPYLCLIVCTIVICFPTSIILTHFGSYLLTLHFNSEDVVTLYMVLGITATVARPIAGVIAVISRANSAVFMSLSLLLLGVVSMFVPLLQHFWMLCVYAALFQLLMGPYSGLGAAMVMEHIPQTHAATAYGLYMCCSVPGFMFGAPIAVWLYHHTQVYAHTFYLAGGLILLSGLTMAPAAYHIHKKTPHIMTNQG